MKNLLIPEIDLACIAPLPYEEKRRALEQLKRWHPPYSYKPVRRVALESLNVDAGPLCPVGRASWAQISREIAKISRTEAEKIANLAVGEAIYDFGSRNIPFGRKQEFYAFPARGNQRLSYWVPAVVALDGRPTVLFIDPRRAKRLTEKGRRFVFSIMHERIRVHDPDFADVELGIIQFGTNKDNKNDRPISVKKAGNMALHDFSEINAMIQDTYDIWQEVLSERAEEARSQSTGTDGDFF